MKWPQTNPNPINAQSLAWLEAPVRSITAEIEILINFHQELLETVKAEKESLVFFDLEKIGQLTGRKEELIAEIITSEKKRKQIQEQIETYFKLAPNQVNKSKIISWLGVGSQIGQDFKKFADELESLIDQIKNATQTNNGFIQSSIEIINRIRCNLSSQVFGNTTVYAKSGKQKQGRSRMLSFQTNI